LVRQALAELSRRWSIHAVVAGSPDPASLQTEGLPAVRTEVEGERPGRRRPAVGHFGGSQTRRKTQSVGSCRSHAERGNETKGLGELLFGPGRSL